jgi:membrane-bound serine protease (ClpP class)
VGKRFALSHSLADPVGQAPSPLLQKIGVAETDLRPGGFARIEGKKLDVVAQRGYVEKGAEIEVVEVHGSRIVVRPVKA